MTVSDWLIKHPGVNQKHFLCVVLDDNGAATVVLWAVVCLVGAGIVVVKFVPGAFCLQLIVDVAPILFWIFSGQFSFCFLPFCARSVCSSTTGFVADGLCVLRVFRVCFFCVCGNNFRVKHVVDLYLCFTLFFTAYLLSYVTYLCLVLGSLFMWFGALIMLGFVGA